MRSKGEDLKIPDADRKLRVTLRRAGKQWVASVGDLSVPGHNSRTARRLIGAMIEQRYGKTAFEVEIELPKSQETAIRRFREDEQRLRELAESVPTSRMRRIHELLGMNLSQEEVAHLLGMTRGHLAVALKRAHDRENLSLATVPGSRRAASRAPSVRAKVSWSSPMERASRATQIRR